jgi:cytidine deaminase
VTWTLQTHPLRPSDEELMARAGELLAARWVQDRHMVATALRTNAGTVHLGVHIQGSAGRSSICAEGIALGTALTNGDLHDVETVVSVQFKPAGVLRVISPCGLCRELLFDYCPDAWVVNYDDGDVARVRAGDLLPTVTKRAW